MSSSSVCQGLQSCLEPRVIEPRVLRLKLAPPGSKFSPPPSEEKESHGWSFLQAITEGNNKNTNEKKDQVYVHPTVKRSSSMLSEKSLEMCTESLGSETGSNASESSDDVSFDSTILDHISDTTVNMNLGGVSRRRVNNNNNKGCNSFPPPLTSITDFGGVHVRPHRHGGRLILEAVASPSPTYFHAERENGRLRLHLFEDVYDSEEEEEEDEEGSDEGQKEGCEEQEEEEEEEEEIGVTKFARRSSKCKESGNRDIFGDGYFERPSLSLCL